MSKKRDRKKSTNSNGSNTRQRANSLLNEGAKLLRQQRPAEAVDRLQRARELNPGSIETLVNLGGAYVLQGRHADAVPVLEEASRVEPKNPMVWINLAAAYLGYLETSDDEKQLKAIAAFERAISIDAQAPSVNYNLGLIYSKRDEKERAAAHFWRALEVDPSDRDARLRLQQLGFSDTRPSEE